MLHYDIHWLIKELESGRTFKFLHFWGHANKTDEEVGKFCFSQWYESPFTVDNHLYKTAEHWMMAQKALLFEDQAIFEQIIQCAKPGEAKSLGRKVRKYDDQVWNEHKFQIVKTGNIHKFRQYPKMADYLFGTGNRVLVEASPVDRIWGNGLAQDHRDSENVSAWPGLNLLGFVLMEVRDLLK